MDRHAPGTISGIHLARASAEEFTRGMDIMHDNMRPLYQAHSLEWKPESLHRHFATKTNYSIWNGGGWRGFVSLEWLESAAFIHTFQVAPGFQGGPVGAGALRALEALCRDAGVTEMQWCAFRGSDAARLYEKMGLEASPEDDHLLNFVYRLLS